MNKLAVGFLVVFLGFASVCNAALNLTVNGIIDSNGAVVLEPNETAIIGIWGDGNTPMNCFFLGLQAGSGGTIDISDANMLYGGNMSMISMFDDVGTAELLCVNNPPVAVEFVDIAIPPLPLGSGQLADNIKATGPGTLLFFDGEGNQMGIPDPNESMGQPEGGQQDSPQPSQETDIGAAMPPEQQSGGTEQQLDSPGEENRFYWCPELTFDNIINLRDFARFAVNWQTSGTDIKGDFNGSGTVDVNDLADIKHYWLATVNWPVEVTSVVNQSVNVTNPVDLATDPNGNIYVLSSSQHQVKIFNSQLQLQNTIDVNALNPKGLAVDANTDIYIADTGHDRILKYTRAGMPDTTFDANGVLGQTGSGDKQFSQPSGITIDSNYKIYVADSNNNRVQIFDRNGSFIGKWGQAGSANGQLNHQSGLCLFGNSEIFVADTGNNRIQRLNAGSGYFLSKIGSYGSGYTQLKAPRDVCYDIAFDQIIVADANNNRLQIFQLHSYGGNSGSQMTFAKAISDRGLSNPSAVACWYAPNDPNQIIFVADTGNNRVLKLRVQNEQAGTSPLDVFAAFKAALGAGNIETAVAFFSDISRDKYRDIFQALGTNMTDYVNGMGNLTLESSGLYTAKYEMTHQSGGQTLYFPVFFVRDQMGNWKVSRF